MIIVIHLGHLRPLGTLPCPQVVYMLLSHNLPYPRQSQPNLCQHPL